MKAYSLDLREKVLRAVDEGFPRGESIKLLVVSRATIKRYFFTKSGQEPKCGASLSEAASEAS